MKKKKYQQGSIPDALRRGKSTSKAQFRALCAGEKERDEKMLLVVDVGNTNITFGIFDGEQLEATFRMTPVET